MMPSSLLTPLLILATISHGSRLFNHTQNLKSINSSAFTTEFQTSYGVYSIRGYEPSESGTYPLYIWLAGTSMSSWGTDAQIYTNYVASNNIVGASVYYQNNVYPSTCNQFRSKASSIFTTSSATSAISVLCSRPKVDCTKGIIVSGFSQGAQLASLSANYVTTPYSITGVYEMGGGDRVSGGFNFESCLAFNTLSLTTDKIRSCVGEFDEVFGVNRNGVRTQQIAITGQNNCGAFATDCIQSDGSGWYIVVNAEAGRTASHCYAYSGTCGPAFTSTYYNGCQLSCEWSLEANLQWLMGKVL